MTGLQDYSYWWGYAREEAKKNLGANPSPSVGGVSGLNRMARSDEAGGQCPPYGISSGKTVTFTIPNIPSFDKGRVLLRAYRSIPKLNG